MTADQFYRLEMLVVFAIDRFGKALDRLDASHFPSATPKAFLQELRSDIANHKTAVGQILDDFPIDPQGATARLRSEHRKLLDKLMHLQAVENAKTDDVPWSLIPSIERMARTLIPGREVLTTALSDFNYQIYWKTAASVGIHRFIILFLPKIHRANAFLHLLIGHELFHPLLQPFIAEQDKLVRPLLRTGCLEIIQESGVALNLFTRNRLDEIVDSAQRYWQKALEEVMCDLGCAAVFGPAAVLSLSTLALTGGLDEKPDWRGQYYPPMRYRLRAVMRHAMGSDEHLAAMLQLKSDMERAKFVDDGKRLSDRLEGIKELTDVTSDLEEIRKEPVIELAYESVDALLPKAWEYVKTLASSVDEQWTKTLPQVPELLRSLELLVPPSEVREVGSRIGKPASWSAIALASWAYQLRSETAAPLDSHLVQFKRVCRLMLKACEDAELKREFASWKTETD
jgi:hypothetical protein